MQDKKDYLLVLLAVLLLVSGCRQTAADRPSQASQPVPEFAATPAAPAAVPTQALPPTATATNLPADLTCSGPYFTAKADRPQYKMNVYASTVQHAVNVQQTIIYPNTAADWLENIRLVIEPNWMPNTFSLTELELGEHATEEYNLSGGYLDIPLTAPLPPQCALVIRLKYVLMLPEQDGLFGYTKDQMMLTNWYPFVPPYHPNWHWQTNNPGSYGEHLVYPLADFEVNLEFQEKNQKVMVASPAPAVRDGAITSYTLKGARTFSLAFLLSYRHLTQTVNDITLHVYYKKASKTAAQAALDALAKSVETYENLFGAYPFESLTTTEIEMYDGMEYDGIFFMGRDVFDSYNRTQQNTFSLMVAHETSHNWWFSQVGSDQAIDPWLDEALATYCELLYLEANYPSLVDWWWDFRIYYYDPYGPVNVTIYDFYDYEPYRQAVYLRGSLFLQAVREQIGDQAFFEFLQAYYQAGEGQITTSELFFDTLAQVTDKEIDSVRWQYLGDW